MGRVSLCYTPVVMPTRTNIIQGLQWLAAGAQPGDALVFHYSGHGAQDVDPSGMEEDGMNETIVPCDVTTSKKMITDDEMNQILVGSSESLLGGLVWSEGGEDEESSLDFLFHCNYDTLSTPLGPAPAGVLPLNLHHGRLPQRDRFGFTLHLGQVPAEVERGDESVFLPRRRADAQRL